MPADLTDVLGTMADGLGVLSLPVKGIKAWSRRDEGTNLLREIQGVIDARWSDEPTRSDVYEQLAPLVISPELAAAFYAVTEGDAAALDEVERHLAAKIGTESSAASADVAAQIKDLLARHVGRAQTSPEAAVDVAVTLRYEQTAQQLDRMEAKQDALLELQLASSTQSRSEPAFTATERHFAALDDAARLVRHDLELIGRGVELEALVGAVDVPDVRVVIQPGRGGIGKTRLVRALAESAQARGRHVLFARPGITLDAAAVAQLPEGDLVVIVDDAHQTDVVLGPLLAAALSRRNLTVVLGTRPGGVEFVRATAIRTGLDLSQLTVLPNLHALGEDDGLALAALAAGEDSERTRRLAHATADSPLETVVGGRLVARGESGEGSGETLRQAVLARFADEQLGRVTERVPADAARRLATLVAALQPLDATDRELMEPIADALDVPINQVIRWLGDLEAAGLVLARGSLRRLVPDALSDQLLLDACADPQGRTTTYADELWATFGPRSPANLLANLAELEWRPAVRGTTLLDAIWTGLESRFRTADAWAREQLLDIVIRAAFQAPERALRIVRIALEDPAKASDWSAVGLRIDDASVRRKLPDLLRRIAEHADHAAEAMTILWELARDDDRPANATPEHALRVLEDLADYRRPAPYREALLDLVTRQVEAPDVDDHRHLPLTLLRPVLAREGMTSRPRGHEIQLGSYNVAAEATQHWRRRIRRLLVDQAMHGTPRRRLAAATVLGEGLATPHGYFGNPVAPDVRDSWRPDQLAIIEAMSEVEAGSDDPPVRHELSRALRWHAEHDPWQDVRQHAEELLGRLDGPDEELIEAIAHPWELVDPDAIEARDARVAARLIGRYPEPAALADALDELISDLSARTGDGDARRVVAHVCRISLLHARGMWAWTVGHADAILTLSAGVALDALRRAGEPIAGLVREGWSRPELPIRRAVAAYVAGCAWVGDAGAVEIEILRAAIESPDPFIRSSAAATVLHLQPMNPLLAAELALRMPLGDAKSAELAFASLYELGIKRLAEDDLDRLVERMAVVKDLGYHASQALAQLAGVDLGRWLEVWTRRLQAARNAESEDGDYQGVPWDGHGFDALAAAGPAARRAALVRLLALAGTLDSSGAEQLGTLFWRTAVPGVNDVADEPAKVDPVRVTEALGVYAAWALNAETDPLLAEALLNGMPWQLVLDASASVQHLLENTSGERRATISGGLLRAAHGVVYGEVRLRHVLEAADARCGELDTGTVAHRFYADLAANTRNELERWASEDEQRGPWR